MCISITSRAGMSIIDEVTASSYAPVWQSSMAVRGFGKEAEWLDGEPSRFSKKLNELNFTLNDCNKKVYVYLKNILS